MGQGETPLRVLLLAFVVLCGLGPAHAVYDLPDSDADCPANCRQVPWRAGADLWNGGVLPVYPAVTCSGLVEGDGTTDNAPAIQSCINSAANDTAVLIPAGMYYVNTAIALKSRVVLRGAGGGPGAQGTWISSTYHGDVGAGSTVTTLKLGPNAYVETPGSGSLGSTVSLASGYTKGSTSLTTSSAHGLAVGDWIVVSENQGDTDIPTSWSGQNGDCTWCGESSGSGYLMTQIVQVASVPSNTTITISRPLYYTFKAALAPRLRKLGIGGQKTGLESMKLWGWSNARTTPHISIEGCVHCWVKDVETYNTPDVAKGYPIWLYRSYGNEIRDSYFHYGQGNGSDRNYGIGIFGPNSDHKIENNILRENRHSLAQEGGGSGNVFLYNYVDDMHTDDLSFLGNTTLNHGAHPYMTLLEGNIVSHFVADRVWGTSSHLVLFRNWLWGDATGNYAEWTSSQPDWGFVAVEIARQQTYYSAVGNVLGNPGLHASWSNALLLPTSCGSVISSRAQPKVYSLGCDGEYSGPYDDTVRATLILHGNYDYKTLGVAHWDGGADHALRDSMYYTSKPAFMGSCPWPVYGPDLSPMTGSLPAKDRYEGVTGCSAVADGGVQQDAAAQPDAAQPDVAAQPDSSTGDACVSLTCVGQGLACGESSDGCGGTLSCGTCTAPEVCSGGTCGCTPTTCAAAGANCGEMLDGCGGTLTCGECTAPDTCGGGGANVCGAGTCTPTTCAAQGAECGPISDGCSLVLDCGSCTAPAVCGGGGQLNQCSCAPKSCIDLGVSCGAPDDGCGGQLECGRCLTSLEGGCGCRLGARAPGRVALVILALVGVAWRSRAGRGRGRCRTR